MREIHMGGGGVCVANLKLNQINDADAINKKKRDKNLIPHMVLLLVTFFDDVYD